VSFLVLKQAIFQFVIKIELTIPYHTIYKCGTPKLILRIEDFWCKGL